MLLLHAFHTGICLLVQLFDYRLMFINCLRMIFLHFGQTKNNRQGYYTCFIEQTRGQNYTTLSKFYLRFNGHR